MAYTQQDIINAVKKQAGGDPNLERAMLYGSWMESSWDPNVAGPDPSSDAPGAWSFGPWEMRTVGALGSIPGAVGGPTAIANEGGATPYGINYAQNPQTAAAYMKGQYQAAIQGNLRAGDYGPQPTAQDWLSNPQLSAATVAAEAEGPGTAYPIAERDPGNAIWNEIQAAIKNKSTTTTTTTTPPTTGNPPEGQLPGGKIGPPAAGFPGSPELPYGPPAAGFPGSPGYTGITTANPPSSYPGMSSQISASLDQQMNPVVHGTGTDAQGNTQPSAGILQDAEGFLTGGIIGSDKYAPLHMIFGMNLKGSAESVLEQPVNNAWNAVKAGLVRFGIGLAGLMIMAAGLWIIVSKIGGGSTPVPVPVPV